ncbi:hypothetical protein QUB18_17225 [Microcoleus sp. B3-D3]
MVAAQTAESIIAAFAGYCIAAAVAGEAVVAVSAGEIGVSCDRLYLFTSASGTIAIVQKAS